MQSDPIGLYDTLNTFSYVRNNPVIYIDPTGEFVPLIVLIPVMGGLVNGIAAEIEEAQKCDSSVGSIMAAFGRGFVSGAGGTLASMGIFAVTGNPFLAGAGGGLAGTALDQAISGDVSVPGLAKGTAVGALTGPLGGKLLPTRGRLPNLMTPRGVTNLGKNSGRLIGQEGLSSAAGGAAGSVTSSGDSSDCGC